MTESKNTSVCIVGAGAMGIITGYHLQLAGAAVTYVVLPEQVEQLSKPQSLYSYDDHSLKTYSGYELIADPTELAGTSFDFVIVTLDGASLRADAGQKLVDEMGRAFRNTPTQIILGSVGIDLRSWFLERTGIAETQVTGGSLGIFIYEAQKATMPVLPGVKPDLVAKADYAYRHPSASGFNVDLSAPQVAHDFTAFYNRNGVSHSGAFPADQHKLMVALMPMIVAWELLGWIPAADIDPANETWQLGTEAMREFQRLSVFGAAGRAASEQANAESVLEIFLEMERGSSPLDVAAFNKYHHGMKVNKQDHKVLREGLSRGEAEGAEMPALRKLIARLPEESTQS